MTGGNPNTEAKNGKSSITNALRTLLNYTDKGSPVIPYSFLGGDFIEVSQEDFKIEPLGENGGRQATLEKKVPCLAQNNRYTGCEAEVTIIDYKGDLPLEDLCRSMTTADFNGHAEIQFKVKRGENGIYIYNILLTGNREIREIREFANIQ